MSTTHYILNGKMNWLYSLFQKDEEYNKYSVDFYPTEESWKTYKEIGLGLNIRENKDTGEEYVRLSRKHDQLIKNTVVVFGPPKVVDAEGEIIPEIGTIGNGSKGMVKIEVYPSAKGKGHRLLEVKLTEIEEFIPDPDARPEAPVEAAGDVVPW
jgi:hypothetical protein